MRETKRKCPKCKSRFGIFLAKNVYKGKSRVVCFNGDCDWQMNILDWNAKYKRSAFDDPGYLEATRLDTSSLAAGHSATGEKENNHDTR